MTKFEEKVLLHSLEVIKGSVRLTTELRKTFGTDFSMIEACIKEDFIKDEAVNEIKRLAPLHFKIGDKVFLLGETTKQKFDLIGDDMHYQPLHELYDMTTEINTGDSYTFYVSDLSFFPFASVEETLESLEFLKSLK